MGGSLALPALMPATTAMLSQKQRIALPCQYGPHIAAAATTTGTNSFYCDVLLQPARWPLQLEPPLFPDAPAAPAP